MIYYDDRNVDLTAVGGKGRGLLKLAKYGFNVPPFFIIVPNDGVSPIEEEIDKALDSLGGDLFAVRSSGIGEDGAKSSFAGQFETKLNVKRRDVPAAVSQVASSMMRGKRYSQLFLTKSSGMAIVVQKQIVGDISGVMFTSSVLSPDEVTIESAYGLGDKVVGGELIPKKSVYKKNDEPQIPYEKELLAAARKLEEIEGHPLDIEWTVENGTLYFLQMRPLTNLGDRLPSIPQRNWNFYVYRDFCRLVHSVQAEASREAPQIKYYGFNVPIYEGLLVNGREFYSDENNRKCLARWAELDVEGFFESFVGQLEKNTKKISEYADRLRSFDASQLTNGALMAKLKRELGRYVASYVPLMMRPDDYLEGKLTALAGEDRAKKMLAAAIAYPTDTYYSSQKRDFLIATISGDFDEYLRKYEWMVSPLKTDMRILTRRDLEDRAKGMSKENAQRELALCRLSRRRDKASFENVICNEDDQTAKLLLTIKDFIRMRTYTAENSDRYFYYIRTSLLRELEKRTGIAEDDLLRLDKDEVLSVFKRMPDKAELLKRASGELTVFYEEDIKTYYGARTYSLLQKLLPPIEDGNRVYGDIACPGETTAVVRIIKNFTDAAKMEKGDILVTSMTTPELVFALDKAAGIITDEGGVTCHAAIIAREYAVPCLVGTKNASRILKDGMRVKLDCINGYFEICE